MQSSSSSLPADTNPPRTGGLHGKALAIVSECAATGEPVFVLRAKDLLSVLVIHHYLGLAELYVSEEHVLQEGVVAELNSFKGWQRDNAGLVKLPD